MIAMIDSIVKTSDLAEEFGITPARVGQLVAAYESEHGETLGEMIGSSRVFSKSEAAKLRRYKAKLRTYKKSEKCSSRS